MIPTEESFDGPEAETISQAIACAHSAPTLHRRVFANGTVHFQKQCPDCGEAVGPAIKQALLTPQQMQTAESWDATVGSRLREQEQAKRDKFRCERDSDFQRKRALQKAEYDTYLRSPKWRAKRTLVMEREKGMRQGCQLAHASEVHHLIYDHIFDELLYELAALCGPCHDKAHFIMPWDQPEGPQ